VPGALVLTPNWEADDESGNRPKAMGVTTSVLIANTTIEFVVTVTQAQVDGGLQLQPYFQQKSGSYSPSFVALSV
jgi:hypothetical protein